MTCKTLCYNNVSATYILGSLQRVPEPRTFEEAVKDTEWVLAMQREISALQDNKTWEIVPLPANKQPIGCKWVYKVNNHSNGIR